MLIDLRLMAFATIWKQKEKELNTEAVKNAIRNGEAEFKFTDYCNITTGKNTRTVYKKDGEIIELDTAAIIAKHCADNDIDIVKETRDNYSVKFTPSEKAYKEYNKMMVELEDSQHRNIAKVATQLANIK